MNKEDRLKTRKVEIQKEESRKILLTTFGYFWLF